MERTKFNLHMMQGIIFQILNSRLSFQLIRSYYRQVQYVHILKNILAKYISHH